MNTKPIECPECDGFGSYSEQGDPVPHRGGFKRPMVVVRCTDCNGSGKARQLIDEDDDIRDTAGFDGFDSHSTYDDWRQP
jgi:DnaJ-class molecular chaperone